MNLLGIITARGGSKRLPGKNMADLGGKPLIQWSIDCGKESCDHLVVTTEDVMIADYCKSQSVQVINRPAELAQDDTPSLPVVVHAASQVREWDAVCLLQPTSPFRTVHDVVACRQIARRNNWNVISVTKDLHQDDLFTIGSLGRLRPAAPTSTVYRVNGAIYIITRDCLLGGDDWYAIAASYVMPPERSIDIDTHSDLDGARALLEKIAGR